MQMLTFSSDWRNFKHFNPILLFYLQDLLLPWHIIRVEGFILQLLLSWAVLVDMSCPVEMGGVWYVHKDYTRASSLQDWIHGPQITPAEKKSGLIGNASCGLLRFHSLTKDSHTDLCGGFSSCTVFCKFF